MLVNVLAFSGNTYLFSVLRNPDVDEQRKRRDEAIEQLQAEQTRWLTKIIEYLGWINEELHRQNRLCKRSKKADAATREYDPVFPQKSRFVGTRASPFSLLSSSSSWDDY